VSKGVTSFQLKHECLLFGRGHARSCDRADAGNAFRTLYPGSHENLGGNPARQDPDTKATCRMTTTSK
jgi:hypothetical protein